MLFHERQRAILCCMVLLSLQTTTGNEVFNDQTTSRANTLLDDADDIQRQLDNEVRDKVSHLKTVWVFDGPTQNTLHYLPQSSTVNGIIIKIKKKQISKTRPKRADDKKPDKDCGCGPGCKCGIETYDSEVNPQDCEKTPVAEEPNWHFWDQTKWHETYEDCGGTAQSPINLPVEGLIHTKGTRKLMFFNYDATPNNLTVVKDGKSVTLYGSWEKRKWPLVFGGAAHSRRYLFHSLSVYWPSEHTIGGLYYPVETQALHISAEYGSFDDAVKASPQDPLAFLGIVNIYKYAGTTQKGLLELVKAAYKCRCGKTLIKPMPLKSFSPPFSDHVCYHGSLTTPPCTQSVLWLVRRKSLPVSRESSFMFQKVLLDYSMTKSKSIPQKFTRMLQNVNDRKIYIIEDQK